MLDNFIARLRGNDPTLTRLVLDECRIDTAGMVALAYALQANTKLVFLSLVAVGLNKIGLLALAAALAINNTLSLLDLSANEIVDFGGGLFEFFTNLRQNRKLTHLFLHNNYIAYLGALSFAICLDNSPLQVLDLSFNQLGNEGAHLLVKPWCNLRELDLTGNSIGDTGAVDIANLLNQSSLTKLILTENSIRDNGMAALAKTLATNTTLKILGLGALTFNLLSPASAREIATMLRTNTALTELYLNNCALGHWGANSLADGLQHNHTLKTLHACGNSITMSAAVALTNTALQHLRLTANWIDTEGAKALASALMINTTLQTLDLGGNMIGTAGAVALASTLLSNRTLHDLNLSDNDIGDDGAFGLASVLAKNMTLEGLGLASSTIGPAGLVALHKAMSYNYTLIRIDTPSTDLRKWVAVNAEKRNQYWSTACRFPHAQDTYDLLETLFPTDVVDTICSFLQWKDFRKNIFL